MIRFCSASSRIYSVITFLLLLAACGALQGCSSSASPGAEESKAIIIAVPPLLLARKATVKSLVGSPSSVTEIPPSEEDGPGEYWEFGKSDKYKSLILQFKKDQVIDVQVWPLKESSDAMDLLKSVAIDAWKLKPDDVAQLGQSWSGSIGPVYLRRVAAVKSQGKEEDPYDLVQVHVDTDYQYEPLKLTEPNVSGK